VPTAAPAANQRLAAGGRARRHQLGAAALPPASKSPAAARIRPRTADSRLAFARQLRYQSRMDRESIDQLARRLAASVPEGLRAVRAELEENFRAVLASGFARMDLVTREEFAVQEAVLERTRAKLDALERRLDALGEGAPTTRTAGKKKTAKSPKAAGSRRKTAQRGKTDS